MMFGFYHHFRKTFTDNRKLQLRMRIEFAIRNRILHWVDFSKSTVLIIQKSFFSEINPRKNPVVNTKLPIMI